MSKPFRKRWVQTMLAATAGVALPLIQACEDGGGVVVLPGAATIRGIVVSFETATAAYLPSSSSPGWNEPIRAFSDFWLPPAHAAVGGVLVQVRGTDRFTRTADDGLFVLAGVPPGRQVLDFSFSEETASLGLAVPDAATVDLGNVRIREGNVQTDPVRVTGGAGGGEDDRDGGGGGDDDGRDEGDDDNEDDDDRSEASGDDDDDALSFAGPVPSGDDDDDSDDDDGLFGDDDGKDDDD